MVTVVPTRPLVGLIDVMTGGWRIVRVEVEVTIPAIPEKVTFPVADPVGTTNVTVVSVDEKLVAATDPILTAVTF